LDKLLELHQAGAAIFLHLEIPTRYSVVETDNPGMPDHLLHTKMLLFDRSDGAAELWVGSHNWTGRALSGLNIEATLVVQLSREERLYQQVASFLDTVRESHCLAFDENLMEWYRWLQRNRGEKTSPLVRVGARVPEALEGQKLTIFGKAEGDLAAFPAVDGRLWCDVVSQSEKKRIVYRAEVLDSGFLEGSTRERAGGMEFDKRFHAYRISKKWPKVQGPAKPSKSRVRANAWHVTLQILNPDPSIRGVFSVEQSERWKPDPSREELRGLDDWFLSELGDDGAKPLVLGPNVERSAAMLKGAAHALEGADLDLSGLLDEESDVLVVRRVLDRD
jgi:hypothetical protein